MLSSRSTLQIIVSIISSSLINSGSIFSETWYEHCQILDKWGVFMKMLSRRVKCSDIWSVFSNVNPWAQRQGEVMFCSPHRSSAFVHFLYFRRPFETSRWGNWGSALLYIYIASYWFTAGNQTYALCIYYAISLQEQVIFFSVLHQLCWGFRFLIVYTFAIKIASKNCTLI